MDLQPIITIPKMDWVPIEVMFILPIFIVIFSLGIYRKYFVGNNG